jgi:hypothetical protein
MSGFILSILSDGDQDGCEETGELRAMFLRGRQE